MKTIIKKWWFWLAIVIFIILISMSITMFYKQRNLKKEISQQYVEISKISSSKKDIEKVLDEKSKLVAQLEQKEKQQEIQNKINAMEDQKKVMEKDINTLNNNKQSLQNDINVLKETVIKIKGEPKKYPAGHLTAGTDFDVGRYKIYGGSSNFVVYTPNNSLKVNIILGDKFGVEEYIYKFENGEKIQAESSFNMVLIN